MYRRNGIQGEVDNELSSPFLVDTMLKQGGSLSPVLFNLALEKVVRELQTGEHGIQKNQNIIKILRFTDDLDVIELRKFLRKRLVLTTIRHIANEVNRICLQIS